jgi:hypothetical protein
MLTELKWPQLQLRRTRTRLWPFEFCKHVRDRAGVTESISSVSGRSALDHFEFTDVRFGMRVPDTATVF